VNATEMTVGTTTVIVVDPGDGHGRSALAAVRALAAAGYRPVVARSGKASLGAASRSCSGTIELPSPDDPGFAGLVRGAAEASGARAVFPASDAALRALGAPGSELVDKSRLVERAHATGFPTPPTQVFENGDVLLDAAGAFDYPIVVKPAVPSMPARRFDAASQLSTLRTVAEPLLVQPFLGEPMRAVGGVIWKGRLVSAVHQRNDRTFPAECGTSSAAVTIEPDADLEGELLRLLDGYEGIFQVQLAGRYLLDLNPRVYGSLPLAVAAGVNLPAVWCDLVGGAEVATRRARPGVRYRWMEGDLRSLFSSLTSGRIGMASALRALRPHRGTAHSVESLRDPGPSFARLRHATRRR
jgi:predicted ATP-grasp superfamily ATP-dependent carboligase